MTLKQDTWWTRFLDGLRGVRRRDDQPHRLPDVGDDGLLVEPAEFPGSEADAPADKPPGGLARWTRRDQTLVKLQEGYERVTQVVEEVQKHLATQGERTDRICNSLEQLARSVSDMPAIARQQGETLQSIAGQLETANARTHQLADAMGEIPKVSRNQTEALTGIKRQLEMSGEQTLLTSQTMDKLGTAIGTLNEFNHAQVQALREMNSQAGQQNEVLAKVLARQGRRFTMLFIVTTVLAVAAVAASIIALVLRP